MPSPVSSALERSIDSFEEFFFHMEQVAPTLHIHAVHLMGSVQADDWRRAWRQLHVTHPLLTVRLSKEPGQRPYFAPSTEEAPIEIGEWPASLDLASLAEEVLARPFRHQSDALVRLEIRRRADECLLVLSAHHSLHDGMALLLLLQDLLHLAASTGEQPTTRSWLRLRDAIGVSERGGYSSALETTETPAAPASLEGEGMMAPKVRHLTLDRATTSRLGEQARAHGVTPHGVLMAAFQVAGAHAVPAWAEEGVSCNTAHSVRSAVEGGAELTGMLTMPIVTRLDPIAGRSFWDGAISAKAAVDQGRSPEAKRAFVTAMDALTSQEVTAPAFLAMIAQGPISYDLMITNYASYAPRTRFGSLRIDQLITGVDGGAPATQTIGACVVDGELNLTLISKAPHDGLLERFSDVLAEIL